MHTKNKYNLLQKKIYRKFGLVINWNKMYWNDSETEINNVKRINLIKEKNLNTKILK